MAAKRFQALVGMNYPPYGKGSTEVRAEPGDIVTNLPPAAIPDLIEQGIIREPGREPGKDGD